MLRVNSASALSAIERVAFGLSEHIMSVGRSENGTGKREYSTVSLEQGPIIKMPGRIVPSDPPRALRMAISRAGAFVAP